MYVRQIIFFTRSVPSLLASTPHIFDKRPRAEHRGTIVTGKGMRRKKPGFIGGFSGGPGSGEGLFEASSMT
jgi:hypothetical protein